MCNCVYILYSLISLSLHTFAQVEFVTKPPREVRTFPRQTVTLPCILRNLNKSQHTVQWAQIEVINSSESQKNISKNREVLIRNLKNFGQQFSILGDGMNFTLLIIIPTNRSIDFGKFSTVSTFYRCSVVTQINDIQKSTSNIIIHKSTIQTPICGTTDTYIIGETLRIQCTNLSKPTILVSLKAGKTQILPFENCRDSYIFYYLTLTKEDHNAIFVCESRRNGTNEVQSCSMGPITVNYKPEINITQVSPMEFHCTAEARPPVNVTHWIVDSSLPKESFTISNSVLKFNHSIKIDSEIKISCEAENSIGKGIKTFIIAVVNNRRIPVVVIVVLCVVVVFVTTILSFLRRKKNQRKQKSKRHTNSDTFASHDDQQVTEFHADHQEKENEIYIAGDRFSDDGTNTSNQKLTYKKLENFDEYKENEIYEGANMNTESERKVMKDKYDYAQVNKPDYKECENEIYQGPE
ncbi:uncharacterized protein LOC117108902 [Anneissia japonica]|uniref:uncharacterized protein LOC117108902 n=1 Tax=Anneissia japonica TaxID=1529436 RepID=UPI00142580CC|nr:uncharacterized protein LOC117108902 [Anneissia japonica]